MANSLSFSEYENILNHFGQNKDEYNIFVETGSYKGDTIFEMKDHFREIHSIELQKNLFDHCVNRFKNNENIKIHYGDSTTVLPQVIGSMSDNIVFFLDGHWCSPPCGRGVKDIPLLEEMESIVKLPNSNCLIIIDDLRLFGAHRHEDWSQITEENLLKFVDGRKFQKLINNDRFIIFLEKNSD